MCRSIQLHTLDNINNKKLTRNKVTENDIGNKTFSNVLGKMTISNIYPKYETPFASGKAAVAVAFRSR